MIDQFEHIVFDKNEVPTLREWEEFEHILIKNDDSVDMVYKCHKFRLFFEKFEKSISKQANLDLLEIMNKSSNS